MTLRGPLAQIVRVMIGAYPFRCLCNVLFFKQLFMGHMPSLYHLDLFEQIDLNVNLPSAGR